MGYSLGSIALLKGVKGLTCRQEGTNSLGAMTTAKALGEQKTTCRLDFSMWLGMQVQRNKVSVMGLPSHLARV